MTTPGDDERDVATLAAMWLGAAVATVEPLGGGRANRTYRVTRADGHRHVFRWYLPDFSPRRDATTIGYEHDVLRRLAGHGMPVPIPHEFEGRTLGEVDGRYFAVFSYLPGEPFASEDPALVDHAASTLARVHAATDLVRDLGQRPGVERYLSLDWVAPGRSAADWFASLEGRTHDGTPLPWRELSEALAPTLAELRDAGYAGHGQVFVHGDVNENNLLAIGGRLTGIIDFDSCRLDSPAFDVAATIWQICRIPPAFDAFDWEAVARLVRGYQGRQPIPIEWYAIVPAAIRAWLLVLYIYSARRLLATGDERAARGLARSMGQSRLGLIEREAPRLLRVVREVAAEAT